jgi:hypothetical protein
MCDSEKIVLNIPNFLSNTYTHGYKAVASLQIVTTIIKMGSVLDFLFAGARNVSISTSEPGSALGRRS